MCQGQLFAGNISVPQGVGSFFFLSPPVNDLALLRGGAGVPLCPIPAGSGMHRAAAISGGARGSVRPGQRRGASPGRFLCYVPRACPLNPARERRGAGERQRSRAERCQPGRDGLGGSLCSVHAARPALRTRRLQNHPLRLHPAGDREYASLRCLMAPAPG